MPIARATIRAALPTKRWYPTWWLRDDFLTDAAAPLSSPHTCEPGPGTLVVLDGNSKQSISNHKATYATGGVTAGNPAMWGSQQTRLTGRAVVGILTQSAQNFEIGWDNDQAATAPHDSIRINAAGQSIRDGGTAVDTGTTFTGGPYLVAIIQRTNGFWAFLRGSSIIGWKLLWVGATSTANLYPAMMISTTTFVGNVDTIRGVDFPAPFDTDYGYATQRLSGARAANDVISHDPNVMLEWVQTTLPASGTTDIRFRRLDANNYLQATVSSTGALTLNSVLAGVTTQIGTSAAAVANGNRVFVSAEGSTVRAYVAAVNKISGTDSNFTGQSDGIISALGTSGAVSDLVTWPIFPSPLVAQMFNMALG